MSRRLLAASLVVSVISVSLAASPARADTKTQTQTQASKQAAAAAARDFKLGLYERALPFYKSAFDSEGKSADGLRALECAQKSYDFNEAFDIATKLTANPKLPKKDRATVDAALAEIDAKTGSIDLTAPVGASVEIGGRSFGAAPLARLARVSVGPTLVRVTAPEKRPFEKIVTIEAGKVAKVTADLSAAQTGGYLFVTEAKGQAVHVFLDDKDVGAAPWHALVAAGTHQVSLKGPKLVASATLVEVENARQQTVTLTAASTVGHVKISVTPAAAQTKVDDTVVPPPRDLELPVGSHRVVASLETYETATRDIEVGPGTTEDVAIQLALAKPAEATPEYQGFYGAFTLNYLQPFKSTNLCSTAPSDVTGCATSSYAGGFALRLGYNTGYVGFEAVVAPFGSYSDQKYHRNATSTTSGTGATSAVAADDEEVQVYGAGGFAGVGPRFTTHGEVARFTLGVQFGVDWHDYFVHRVGGSSGLGNSNGNTAINPAMMADLGIMLGSTPGAKFFLGPVLYLDFQKAMVLQQASDTTPTLAFDGGTSVFFGGMIGLFFGH